MGKENINIFEQQKSDMLALGEKLGIKWKSSAKKADIRDVAHALESSIRVNSSAHTGKYELIGEEFSAQDTETAQLALSYCAPD